MLIENEVVSNTKPEDIDWNQNFFSTDFTLTSSFDVDAIQSDWDLCEASPNTDVRELIQILTCRFGLCYPNMTKNVDQISLLVDTTSFVFSKDQTPVKFGDKIVPSGSMVYIKNKQTNINSLPMPGITQIIFSNQIVKNKVFLKTSSRNRLANLIKETLKGIFEESEKFCVEGKLADEDKLKIVKLQQFLGKGCYGNIYLANINRIPIAIKIAKIPGRFVKNPIKFSENFKVWNEYNVMNKMIAPVLASNTCPNLPLVYSSFTCDSCNITTIRPRTLIGACAVFLTELADGDLTAWAKQKARSVDEYKSCLFQLMAGVMALQKYYQVVTYDMKAQNILYHNVPSGGYWKYRIQNFDYYVPNFGTVFIINDFGTSVSFKPDSIFQNQPGYTYGCRPGVVMADHKMTSIPFSSVNFKKNINATRIQVSHVSLEKNTDMNKVLKLNDDQLQVLSTRKISTYFDLLNDSETFPPLDFIFDTQDIINLFLNEYRTVFPDYKHVNISVPKIIQKKMRMYHNSDVKYNEDESIHFQISTNMSQMLAEYFIEDYFRDEILFHYDPNKKIICEYDMDKFDSRSFAASKKVMKLMSSQYLN